MGIVHRAELKPSKLELLTSWLPMQPWFADDGPIERESAFRLDDPDGEVGIETFIMRSGPFRFHVPLTYRAAPLEGGLLVGELEHSALGHRWVYDGPTDPVYVSTTTTAIVEARRDVDMVLDDGTPVPRIEWWANAIGSGADATRAQGALHIARAIPSDPPPDAPTLDATWLGQESPVSLAWLD